ncbi:MAG: hypothetical protein IIX13_05770 [Bacteroidales bacterium]|nr:hypothetical protein [Bacteroidales bacterium]
MQDLQKINFRLQTADEIPPALNQADCPWHQIAQCNWPEKFSYRPKVAFRIAYTDEALLLHYRVEEECIMALAEDNGPIWTDSCVECFISPAEDGYYYNIEANCIGNMLIGCGQSRHDRERGDKKVRDKVLRWSSLGREPLGERPHDAPWELALLIPFSCFFKHQIDSLDGRHIRANFYKCGDGLSKPHYLSWQPINTEKPDFHRPEFFGTLYCK